MLALLSAVVLAAAAQSQPAQPAPITFDHLLVIEPQGGGSRTPFRADPVLAGMMAANWHAPALGDKVGDKIWQELKPKEDGSFEGRALAGGYAFATFDAPADGVMMLEAAGHVMVYVNPTPTTFEMHTGDPYENGSVRVPIEVHKGTNSLLFAAGRGHMSLRVTAPPAPVFISPADATMPDLYEGMPNDPDDLAGSLLVVNATEDWQSDLAVLGYGTGLPPSLTSIPAIPPLSVRKVPVAVPVPSKPEPGDMKFQFALKKGQVDPLPVHAPSDSVPFTLRVRKPDQTRKITFKSAIDGSVQYFGYNPPAHVVTREGALTLEDHPGLILSLHGASVEAAHQAECYSLKPWAALAAPTNRREYGFDWEDWGRLDALEVLGIAKSMTKPDPQRIYLTGHSMGGHGTWINGATYPDMFAAMAPSAGWTTFWSYGGANHFDKDPTPIEKMIQRAMNPGDTIALAKNTAAEGVYILHGDADDNVPVEQARSMRKLLGEFHRDFVYYERPGAGHWWGNECMDWPPLMDFLKSHTIPKDKDVKRVHFTTANAAVSSKCHWATIVQQEKGGDLSSIDVTFDPKDGFKGTTKNVAVLSLNATTLGVQGTTTILLDGASLEHVLPATDGMIRLTRTTTAEETATPTWAPSAPTPPTQKNPARSGPFKHAFNRKTVLVYGTRGSPEENAWMLAKARLDAETIWYRGNGCFDIVADTDFNPEAFKDRSVLLYGNDDINAAWTSLLPDSPLTVHRGGLFIGEHEFKDDWFAALFVRPRKDSAEALVGAVAFTGLRGARAAERLPYFSSGVAYPDWTIFSARTLSAGMAGVEAAGYFDNAWRLDESQSAWGTP
jgi:hypothetical protein